MSEADFGPAASVGRNAASVADRIEALPQSDARLLVAIAGAPGSGKSTLAAAVVEALTERGTTPC